MSKPVRVVLLGEAEEEFKKLNEIVGRQLESGRESSEEIQLLRSIKQKVEFIKNNPFYGEPIAKNLIPEEYKLKYKSINLFRVELSQFWRMLYTLKGDEIEIVAFVLDIIDHPEYNKKFGYRKK
jgi:Txe/YoeB family toxin of Txe-Axe toxin-antitoxin module